MMIRCLLSLTLQVIHIIISQLEEAPVSSNPHTIGLELLGGEINRKSRDSGMALGFFILGPGTHISDQIGVPSIFCGSQSSPQKIALEKKSSK